MSVDVRKTITDAGYIAVGVGVLGFQQVQTRRRGRSTERVAGNGSPLHVVSAQTKDIRLKVKSNLDRATRGRADLHHRRRATAPSPPSTR